ncbi:MAG: hypothetical protein GF381_04550 [Candidatus Pacebacteria bacterium]|nr:hypothetical protein [Candidatus Paceibacterota bacterium]
MANKNKNTKDKQEIDQNLGVSKDEQVVIPLEEEEVKQAEPPYEEGETSASGHMPEPEVDDNALEMAQEPGLYLDADEENPVELNLAKQVEQAEKERRGK